MDCLVKNGTTSSSSFKSNLIKKEQSDCKKDNELNDTNKSEETKEQNDRSSSPSDEKCPICLVVPIENLSKANKCYHSFCKCCILEWAKVRMECPLCRQPFNSIIYDIKSDFDFKEYDRNTLITKFGAGRSNTSVPLLSPFLSQVFSISALRSFTSSAYLANQIRNRQMQPGTLEHRRYIYAQSLYVMPLSSSRRREANAQFYRRNPACIQRLTRFLHLELRALIHNDNEYNIVLQLIINSLTNININSTKFQQLISQFTLHRTVHFIHEFYNFAISALDSHERYFEDAVYLPMDQIRVVTIQRDNDPDDDDQILDFTAPLNNNRARRSRYIFNVVNNDNNNQRSHHVQTANRPNNAQSSSTSSPSSINRTSSSRLPYALAQFSYLFNSASQLDRSLQAIRDDRSNSLRSRIDQLEDDDSSSDDSDIEFVFEGKIDQQHKNAKPIRNKNSTKQSQNNVQTPTTSNDTHSTSNNNKSTAAMNSSTTTPKLSTESNDPKPSTSGLQNHQNGNFNLNHLREYTDDSDSDYDYNNLSRPTLRSSPFYQNDQDQDNGKTMNQSSLNDLDDDDDSIEYVGFVRPKKRIHQTEPNSTIELIELTDDEDEQINNNKRFKSDHHSSDKAINCKCKVMCKYVCKKDD